MHVSSGGSLQGSTVHGSTASHWPALQKRPVAAQSSVCVAQEQMPSSQVGAPTKRVATSPAQEPGGVSPQGRIAHRSTVSQAPSTHTPPEARQFCVVSLKRQAPATHCPSPKGVRTVSPSQVGDGRISQSSPAQGSATHAPPMHVAPVSAQSIRASS